MTIIQTVVQQVGLHSLTSNALVEAFPKWDCIACVVIEKENPYEVTVRFMAALGDEEFRTFVVIDADFMSEKESVKVETYHRVAGLLLSQARFLTEDEATAYLAEVSTREGLHNKRFANMAVDVLTNMFDTDLTLA